MITKLTLRLDNNLIESAQEYSAQTGKAASHAGAKYMVTRNIGDFKNSTLPVFEPRACLNALESLKNKGGKVKL